MGYRDIVLYVGYDQIGNSLKSNPDAVKEYINFSCSQTVNNHLKVSWCTHFVHWVIDRAGMQGVIPKAPLGDKSTGRMPESFPKTTNPRPGDIYYMPVVGGKTTHHFGLVSQVYDGEIESLDGNSGSWKDPRTDWTTPTGGGIGGGMVCLNNRKISEIAFFLEITPDDF
jgi:CHAP domain-containing protein